MSATELQPTAEFLEQFEPQRYYAVWQHVEGYYAFMGFQDALGTVSFLMVAESEEVADGLAWLDAAENMRSRDLYEVHPLTLMEAFDAARSRPLPILYPGGSESYRIGGLAVFNQPFGYPSEFIAL